jgi:hypothetical protein
VNTFADFGAPSIWGQLPALVSVPPQRTHTEAHPWRLSDPPSCLIRDFTAGLRRDMAAALRAGDTARFTADAADLADVLATGLLTPAQRRRAVHKWHHAQAAQA